MQPRQTNIKVLVFRAFVVVAFAVLAFQTWQLQIVQGGGYVEMAEHNRFRLQTIDAPRGVIYDRQGRLLVGNVPSFTVSIVPADLPEEDQDYVFEQLSALLDIPISIHDWAGSGEDSVDHRYLTEDRDYEPEPQMMERVEEGLAALGCSKLNLQVRATNTQVVSFYKRLGYQVEERVSMAKRLSRSGDG